MNSSDPDPDLELACHVQKLRQSSTLLIGTMISGAMVLASSNELTLLQMWVSRRMKQDVLARHAQKIALGCRPC
jgi:hypothetical protein